MRHICFKLILLLVVVIQLLFPIEGVAYNVVKVLSSYKLYHRELPDDYTYVSLGNYRYTPTWNLLAFPVYSNTIAGYPGANSGIYVANIVNNNSRILHFVDFEPYNVYITGSKLLIVGEYYENPTPGSIFQYGDAIGFYLVDPLTYKIVAKQYVKMKIATFFTGKDVVRLNYTSYLLYFPMITTRSSSYNSIYLVRVVNDRLNVRLVFSYKAEYYPYTKPIIYKDKIYWGAYIVDLGSNNSTIILEDTSRYYIIPLSMIHNDTYIYTVVNSTANPNTLTVKYYDINNRSFTYTEILYKVYDANISSIMFSDIFYNRYMVFVLGLGSEYGLLDLRYIVLLIYDIVDKSITLIKRFNTTSIYTGKYRDYVVLGLPMYNTILFVDPKYNLIIPLNISGIKMLGSSIGNLIVDYDLLNGKYMIILLPLFSSTYLVIILDENEIPPLDEARIIPIFMAILVLFYITRYKNRKAKNL